MTLEEFGAILMGHEGEVRCGRGLFGVTVQSAGPGLRASGHGSSPRLDEAMHLALADSAERATRACPRCFRPYAEHTDKLDEILAGTEHAPPRHTVVVG